VAVGATIAPRWLIPRLASFQDAYPEIEARLLTTSRMVDLAREDVDLSIRSGDGRWPRCRSDFVIANDLFPVASLPCCWHAGRSPQRTSPATS
jgi:LysR family glycine cleavage system transcriptional activator